MGTTTYLAMNSMDPTWADKVLLQYGILTIYATNIFCIFFLQFATFCTSTQIKKVELAVLLAPVAFVDHMNSPIKVCWGGDDNSAENGDDEADGNDGDNGDGDDQMCSPIKVRLTHLEPIKDLVLIGLNKFFSDIVKWVAGYNCHQFCKHCHHSQLIAPFSDLVQWASASLPPPSSSLTASSSSSCSSSSLSSLSSLSANRPILQPLGLGCQPHGHRRVPSKQLAHGSHC